jgi:hypothetical protein
VKRAVEYEEDPPGIAANPPLIPTNIPKSDLQKGASLNSPEKCENTMPQTPIVRATRNTSR